MLYPIFVFVLIWSLVCYWIGIVKVELVMVVLEKDEFVEPRRYADAQIETKTT